MKAIIITVLLIFSLYTQAQEIKPQQYRSKIIAGTTGIVAGVGFVGWGFGLKANIDSGEQTKHSIQEARLLMLSGALFGGIGIALSVKGAKLRGKYIDAQIKNNSVSLNIYF